MIQLTFTFSNSVHRSIVTSEIWLGYFLGQLLVKLGYFFASTSGHTAFQHGVIVIDVQTQIQPFMKGVVLPR